jgi:hypothetical protein
MRVALLVLFAPVATLALDATPPGPAWTVANKTSDLVVFTKDDPAGGARHLKAVSEMEAPPAKVFEAVAAFDEYPKFMPYVKEARLVSKQSEAEFVSYALLSPPLVSDRDYAIAVKLTKGSAENGGVYRSEWSSRPDAEPERKGVVRIQLNTGSWTIEPLDGGKRSKVTYALHTHPGGSIPMWVANKSNTVAIPDLFKAVRKRATER